MPAIEPPASFEIVGAFSTERAAPLATVIAPLLTITAFDTVSAVLALITIFPVFVMFPCRKRPPPIAGSLVIVPLLVSVPDEIASVARLPLVSLNLRGSQIG